MKNEAPRSCDRGIFSPLLRWERNPSEAENSSYSSPPKAGFSAKGDKKILVICGPTATGKTSLGIGLSKKFGGEIISADSRQVYQGMDIATGKDLPVNHKFQKGCYLFDGISVWLLDIVEPDVKFTVVDYYDLAWKVIKDIWKRGKLPIVVGGTGFYIKALLEGIGTMGIAPDWILREELKDKNCEELQNILREIKLERIERMNDSDRKNPRRLLRAIEVELYRKRNGKKENKRPRTDFEVLSIGLTDSLVNLYRKIDDRIEEQIKKGAQKEVEKLIEKGYSWNLPSMTAMGYGEWQNYFEGKKEKPEIIKIWKFNEHGYARRQMTWFRKTQNIQWFDIGNPNWSKQVEKLVKDWYS